MTDGDTSPLELEREAARLSREYNRRWVESIVGEELDWEDGDAR